MLKKEITITIIALLIALSGWGKVLYDYITSKPKIRGRVFQVMRGQMNHPQRSEEQLATFLTYLYLLNTRKNSIHILDYGLEVKIKNNWIRLDRVYGIHNIPNMSFLDPSGQEIKIKNFSENLIYKKSVPVEYGKPLHGWILFVGDASLYTEDISEYRLTCIDAYKKHHVIKTKPKEFENIYLLQDLADISIPKEAVINP